MARKKSGYKRMKKIEPAVQTMVFNFSVPVSEPGTTTTNYIDLSQCASLLNRRFYRQGINWAVSGFKFLTGSDTTGLVAVQKLPETWIMSNSWEKGFRSWQRMNNEALSESESVRPRFLDFKIYADSDHHAAGFANNLLPTVDVFGGIPAIPGEWAPSKFVIPVAAGAVEGATNDREIIAVGGNYPGAGASGLNAVSLIEGYANSRALPAVLDPNVPDDMSDTSNNTPENWISATFNDGTQQTEDVLTDMEGENNIAPYPFENDGVNVDTMYPNGENQLSGLQIHDVDTVTLTSIGSITRMKGGMFPSGLIRLDIQNTGVASMNVNLLIDLVPGNHRGYLCEPMTEM